MMLMYEDEPAETSFGKIYVEDRERARVKAATNEIK